MSAATPTPVQPNPLGGESYRLTLPNTAAAPRIARDFLTSLLGVSRHPGLVDDARLCVTELVTNAHCHTRTPLIGVHVAVNRKRSLSPYRMTAGRYARRSACSAPPLPGRSRSTAGGSLSWRAWRWRGGRGAGASGTPGGRSSGSRWGGPR
ncbi:ATP-binding protein [Streptomyces cyaneofuscatus]|uniref:ATP-binding protein n=1 Tax=Streptomyces cyaneofuscatus TaxID=66883 RepID=A0ABZ1EYU4_9ACTN|nr:ATP-binding protein [Streptomyces cyaneofuscatus]WSB09208.1 ATP-binding protein [Streptomyces cyaneofuscatus]WSD47256.1 ATP-binding protein [Streptomyces cyaneofuscatus]WTA90656.1 ATP-binding protein [Streptomyces cyaneofuscatus]